VSHRAGASRSETRQRPSRVGSAATLFEKPVAVIMVECARPSVRPLDDAARDLAQNFHGVVADRPTTLGGAHALLVVAKNDVRALHPVEGLVAIHDGLFYLVMGGVLKSFNRSLKTLSVSRTWNPARGRIP
jgi:hypothetical protein